MGLVFSKEKEKREFSKTSFEVENNSIKDLFDTFKESQESYKIDDHTLRLYNYENFYILLLIHAPSYKIFKKFLEDNNIVPYYDLLFHAGKNKKFSYNDFDDLVKDNIDKIDIHEKYDIIENQMVYHTKTYPVFQAILHNNLLYLRALIDNGANKRNKCTFGKIYNIYQFALEYDIQIFLYLIDLERNI